MRPPWWSSLLAATAIGAGVGAAVAAAGDVEYKAQAKVVVQAKGGVNVVLPLLLDVRELATSSILAGNVDSTLRLPGSADRLRKRLHASIASGSQVVVLSVTDGDRDRARQIAQEAAVVLTQLVPARFRTPPLNATVLDPAHVVSHRGRHFVRDALIGAGAGLALALAAVLALGGLPAAAPTDEKLAERERQLEERIDLVTKRERALAKRAGELAKRERAAQAREAAEQRQVAQPPPEPASPGASPIPEPTPVAATPERSPELRAAAWNLNELERLVETRSDAPPETLSEWRTYLFLLRPHAGADGTLPWSFDALVDEVFGALAAGRSTSAN